MAPVARRLSAINIEVRQAKAMPNRRAVTPENGANLCVSGRSEKAAILSDGGWGVRLFSVRSSSARSETVRRNPLLSLRINRILRLDRSEGVRHNPASLCGSGRGLSDRNPLK